MQADTHKNFFRQSGWMMVANLLCGVFMMGVHPFAVKMNPPEEYAVFMTMLRVFVLITIPAVALQVILAHQTAAAITDAAKREVAATARGLLKYSFIFWLLVCVFAAAYQKEFAMTFKAPSRGLIWATMLLILAALWMPIFHGLLQGLQNFFPLGWSMILNGVGRVAAIAIGVLVFQVGATGSVFAAFVGVVSAVVLAAWPARVVFQHHGGIFDWRAFLKKVAPLTAGAGSTLFLINVDMILVQSHFQPDDAKFYAAAEAIGIALVTLCVPVAAVMFPKLVRSRATGSGSNALYLAVMTTAALAGATAIFCTIFPKLPLQIMFFTKPEYVKAYVLIPWFMWAMIPVTMYNVLINSLIARERYGIMFFAAGLPIAYAFTLHYFLSHTTLPPFEAFKAVIQILMGFSSALLAVSIYFSLRASREDAVAGRSAATAATP